MAQKKNNNTILIYSPIFYPDIGGPAIQGQFLAMMLEENGFDVHVLKYNKNLNKNSRIRVISLNWGSNPNLFTRIYRWSIGPLLSLYYLLKIRPNIVIVNSVFWNGMVMGLICRIIRIPSILKFAGDWVFESSKSNKHLAVDFKHIYRSSLQSLLLFYVEKFFLSQFKVIWVISNFRRDNVLRISNKPKIWLQRNFHSLPPSSMENRHRFTTPIIFVTSARLIPHKRIDVLIETLSKLPTNYKFIIIGDGSELSKLQSLVTELNLTKIIFFTGQVSDILLYKILQLSSVYLSWSAEEGAPNAFIEALHFGLPIISANVGGIPEMFAQDSKAVRLIDPNNPAAFYNCLQELILNPHLFQEMSMEALEEAKKFSTEYNKQNFLTLLASLL